ncbi:hypothetical protein [Chromobacterium piscinae]
MLNTLIVGASGYAGVELATFIHRHPHMNITALAVSAQSPDAGKPLSDLHPQLKGVVDLPLQPLSSAAEWADKVDVVFLDINIPSIDGLLLAKNLHKAARPPRIVFVDHRHFHFLLDHLDHPLGQACHQRVDQQGMEYDDARQTGRAAAKHPAVAFDGNTAHCDYLPCLHALADWKPASRRPRQHKVNSRNGLAAIRNHPRRLTAPGAACPAAYIL